VPMKARLPLTLLVSAGSIVTLGVVAYVAAHSVTNEPPPQVILTPPTRTAVASHGRLPVPTTIVGSKSEVQHANIDDAVGARTEDRAHSSTVPQDLADPSESTRTTIPAVPTSTRAGPPAGRPASNGTATSVPPTTTPRHPVDDGSTTTTQPEVPVTTDDRGGSGDVDTRGGHRGPG
jgi:hypothetical protein